MPERLKGRRVPSDNALVWIGGAVALAAAIVLDDDTAPRKWHAAIIWTVIAFLCLLVLCRKKWTFVSFWLFGMFALVAHICVMWFIFGQLLPGLLIGTLFTVPLGFIESILLTVIFSGVERRLEKRIN